MRAMETPPQYAPPRKKSNTGLIIALVLGGIAVCCIGGVALLGFFGFNFFKNTIAPMAECAINYEIVHKSMLAYTKDHEGTLPAASKWQDELAPYVEKELAAQNTEGNPFKLLDPKGEWSCTTGTKKTGMAFNSEFDGKKLADAIADDKVIVFETDGTGRNLAEKYAEKPMASSPQMMGKPRGWILIRAASGAEMGGKPMAGKFDLSK